MENKQLKNVILVLGFIIIVLIIGFGSSKKIEDVSNFEECVLAGNLVMESYPRQCRTKDGKTFTEDIGNAIEKSNLIQLDIPRPNDIVASPLGITGRARGNWYFEASFPAEIIDANGTRLVILPIQAQGEWMTTEFVPFSGTLTFSIPTTSTGTLILHKDNPSGLPENDDSLRLPIRFK
ncbi:MAG TPA: Gmad2 immunoglobulin-like domain-containing protein [Candidatus Paceibacterota bacterium]